MKVDFVPLIGIPSDSFWPSMVTFDTATGGTFYCVVAVGPDPQSSGFGRTVIEQIQALSLTEVTQAKVTAFFSQPFSFPVAFAGGIIKENTLLCFASAGASVYLYRDGNQEKIASPLTPPPIFLQGQLQDADRVVFGTNSFFSECPHIVGKKTLQETADGCAVTIQTSPHTAEISAIMVQCGQAGIIPDTAQSVVETTQPTIAKPTTEEPATTQRVLPVVRPSIPRVDWMSVARKYRKLLSVVLAILVLLLLFLGVSQFAKMQRQRKVVSSVEPYQARIEQAKSGIESDRMTNLQLLRDLRKELTEKIEQSKKDKTVQRAYDEQLQKVNELYANYSGEKNIDKLSVYYDFRLVSQDFVASQVAYDRPGKQAVFLDGGHSKLLSLSLEKKQPQILSVDDKLQNPFALTVLNRKAYVLGKEGVVELSLPLDQIGRTAVEPNESWMEPKKIGGFGTSAYVLDTTMRNIYKYDLENQGASPSAWLTSKEGIDFEKLTTLTVDGDVWLTTDDGEILKFTRGDQVKFTVSGMLDPFNSAVLLYTEEESTHLFVLEPRQKRIVVLDKSGAFVSSVHSEDLLTATSLIVDEESKKAYVLSGSLVYDIALSF